MTKEVNGFTIFEEADMKSKVHPAFKALEGLDLPVEKMRYGFTLVEKDGQKKALPIDQAEYEELMKLVNPSFDPVTMLGCYKGQYGCVGFCGSGYLCNEIYRERDQKYFCGCT